MKTLFDLSKRHYEVAISEAGKVSIMEVSISDLFTEDKEAVESFYAMQDMIDDILDLKRTESMYFKPNRDNDMAKGIITRIN